MCPDSMPDDFACNRESRESFGGGSGESAAPAARFIWNSVDSDSIMPEFAAIGARKIKSIQRKLLTPFGFSQNSRRVRRGQLAATKSAAAARNTTSLPQHGGCEVERDPLRTPLPAGAGGSRANGWGARHRVSGNEHAVSGGCSGLMPWAAHERASACQ